MFWWNAFFFYYVIDNTLKPDILYNSMEWLFTKYQRANIIQYQFKLAFLACAYQMQVPRLCFTLSLQSLFAMSSPFCFLKGSLEDYFIPYSTSIKVYIPQQKAWLCTLDIQVKETIILLVHCFVACFYKRAYFCVSVFFRGLSWLLRGGVFCLWTNTEIMLRGSIQRDLSCCCF